MTAGRRCKEEGEGGGEVEGGERGRGREGKGLVGEGRRGRLREGWAEATPSLTGLPLDENIQANELTQTDIPSPIPRPSYAAAPPSPRTRKEREGPAKGYPWRD